ncbi:MAG TPA: hypothetical protein VJ689_03975 [Gaiellaceae bacterium]|nr:hypothetical protein [Gaiellaceae bacterium]
MAMQTPTRITIEVHPADARSGLEQPIVRVVPAGPGAPAAPNPVPSAIAAEPRETVPAPAPYEPGPCRCLDDEDCAADHANE